MFLLNEILKELLFEDVSIDNINDAIHNKYEVEINYHSKGENIATGKRVIQPVAYGLTKAGNPVIRAFQPYGDTTSKVPSWKFFRVDRISKWMPNKRKTFSEPPGVYDAIGAFNPDGDKTMSTVYTIANFKQRNNLMANNGPIAKDDLKDSENNLFKTDTERGIERLKKQLENPQYISGFNKNNYNNKELNKPLSNKNSETKNNNLMNGPINKNDLKDSENNLFKTDTEKGIERLRKQLENPQYISDLIKLKNFNNKNNNLTNGPINKNDLKDSENNLFKTDTERGIERLRKQLENPQYISDYRK